MSYIVIDTDMVIQSKPVHDAALTTSLPSTRCVELPATHSQAATRRSTSSTALMASINAGSPAWFSLTAHPPSSQSPSSSARPHSVSGKPCFSAPPHQTSPPSCTCPDNTCTARQRNRSISARCSESGSSRTGWRRLGVSDVVFRTISRRRKYV